MSELTLIVPQGEPENTFDEAYTEQSKFTSFLGFGTKKVKTDELADQMKVLRSQVDEILEAAPKETDSGFRLEEVQVSLAVNAQGTIGIASAGVEASISLTFKRPR